MTETKETPKAEPEITADTGPYYPAEHGITGSDGFRGPSISWFVGRNKLGEARQIAQIANIAFAEGAKAERAMISERDKTIEMQVRMMDDKDRRLASIEDQARNARHGCKWRQSSDGYWDTGCGEAFEFNNGTPTENSQVFCGFCGGGIEEIPYVDEDAEVSK